MQRFQLLGEVYRLQQVFGRRCPGARPFMSGPEDLHCLSFRRSMVARRVLRATRALYRRLPSKPSCPAVLRQQSGVKGPLTCENTVPEVGPSPTGRVRIGPACLPVGPSAQTFSSPPDRQAKEASRVKPWRNSRPRPTGKARHRLAISPSAWLGQILPRVFTARSAF